MHMNRSLNETVREIRKEGFKKIKEGRLHFWREKDYLNKTVDAGVVILPTRGCRWGRMSGCSMCGYAYNASNSTQSEIFEQFEKALAAIGKVQYLKIFNSGSFFDASEISRDTAKKIFSKINENKEIKRVQLESRPEFLDYAALQKARETLNAELEVGIGLETASDEIRENCINKNFTMQDFKSALKTCNDAGVMVKAYILIKPLFLSEKEAIEDAIESACTAYKLGAGRISFNPVNVQKATLAEHLWNHGEYRPPWLWSVVKVLKSVKQKVKVPVLSHPTAAGKERGAHNCGKCDREVYHGIVSFSATQKFKYLENLSCECMKTWENAIDLEQFEHG